MKEKTPPSNLISLLLSVFDQECMDVFVYGREARLLREKIEDSKQVADVFEQYSQEELRHADRIAMMLIEYGMQPQWRYTSFETRSSLIEILADHLKRESSMYFTYGEILKYIKDPDDKLIIEGIRENESQHVEKITHLLNHIKK